MFEKKSIIFSDSLGVCVVADVPKISANKVDFYNYYLLQSVFDKTKVSYIPVDKHEVLLRELISPEEAIAAKNTPEFEKMDKIYKDEIEYVIKKQGQAYGK